MGTMITSLFGPVRLLARSPPGFLPSRRRNTLRHFYSVMPRQNRSSSFALYFFRVDVRPPPTNRLLPPRRRRPHRHLIFSPLHLSFFFLFLRVTVARCVSLVRTALHTRFKIFNGRPDERAEKHAPLSRCLTCSTTSFYY